MMSGSLDNNLVSKVLSLLEEERFLGMRLVKIGDKSLIGREPLSQSGDRLFTIYQKFSEISKFLFGKFPFGTNAFHLLSCSRS